MSDVWPAEIIFRNIARVRRYRGLTQAELAEAVTGFGFAMTREIVTNIETGRRADIGVNEWHAIAAALAIPPSALMQEDPLT